MRATEHTYRVEIFWPDGQLRRVLEAVGTLSTVKRTLSASGEWSEGRMADAYRVNPKSVRALKGKPFASYTATRVGRQRIWARHGPGSPRG